MKITKQETAEIFSYNWIDANDIVEEDITSLLERT